MGSVRRSRFKESLFLEAARSGRLVVDRDGSATLDGRPISQHGNGRGYRLSRMTHEKKRYSIMHHCLVWAFFHGPIPVGEEINHINGDKLDNRLANLELATRGGNLLHACRTGLRDQAGISRRRWARDRGVTTKLNDTKVREIRRRCAAGETQAAVAADYGINQVTVSNIVRRKRWASVC